MKNVVGQVVRDDDFFPRANVVKQLWKQINNGSSILISAPRRVGKTSLMRFIQDNPKENYYFVYLTTESIDNEVDYYKRLWDEVIESNLSETDLKKSSKRLKDGITTFLQKISSVGADGIELNNSSSVNYYDRFVKLLKEINLYGDKLIIMVDEFPQTIENIRKKYDEKTAISFLQKNRELRQNPKISDKVQFIYAGSIGLEYIVNNLNSNSTTNDLDPFKIEPLTTKEASILIDELAKTEELKLNKLINSYIVEKIEWLIPYYIQITIKELSNANIESELEITKDNIDEVFKKLISNKTYFGHWQTRLRDAYKTNHYKFTEEVLNKISTQPIDLNEIYNIAVGLSIEDDYKDIIRALEHDGYIHKDEQNLYRFTSPILKMWWNKDVAN